jgi:hypothetical protein
MELSIEELRAKALEALTTPEQPEVPAEPEKADPPRDEKGRFVKAESDTVEEVDEVVYERVIDLGDGSGTQVFRGNTMEELIDKLATAQENATRKIRELSAKEKATAIKQVEENDELTEDEKFILSQKILTDPAKVIETFVEKTINKKINPRLKDVEGVAREQRETKTAVDWVNSTPDYYACDSNGKKIHKYLETQGLEMTRENLQAAFEDLNADGLLVSKPKEKQDAESDTDETGSARIAPKVETGVVRRKVVGGLSTKRQAQVETKPSEPTVDDLYKMPMDKLRELTYRSIRGQ